jgi:hypothetical protein
MEQNGTLVLVEKKDRAGATKRFDVVRAEAVAPEAGALTGLPEGDYVTLHDGRVERYGVEYELVQHTRRR